MKKVDELKDTVLRLGSELYVLRMEFTKEIKGLIPVDGEFKVKELKSNLASQSWTSPETFKFCYGYLSRVYMGEVNGIKNVTFMYTCKDTGEEKEIIDMGMSVNELYCALRDMVMTLNDEENQ